MPERSSTSSFESVVIFLFVHRLLVLRRRSLVKRGEERSAGGRDAVSISFLRRSRNNTSRMLRHGLPSTHPPHPTRSLICFLVRTHIGKTADERDCCVLHCNNLPPNRVLQGVRQRSHGLRFGGETCLAGQAALLSATNSTIETLKTSERPAGDSSGELNVVWRMSCTNIAMQSRKSLVQMFGCRCESRTDRLATQDI